MSGTEQRIVLVDNHIIAQFNQNTGPGHTASWYTMSKADNNNEDDFAVWPLSQANLSKAHRLIAGECKIVEAPSSHKVKQHDDSRWYIHRGSEIDTQTSYYDKNMALRNLARSL
jgi:hypothetical protein